MKKLEPIIYLLILIAVIFVQIDSFFLNGKFFSREMNASSHVIWVAITIFCISRIIKIFSFKMKKNNFQNEIMIK